MVKITDPIKEKKKNTIINISMVVVAVIVFVCCLTTVLNRDSEETKDIVLVRDMSEGTEGRIISNKTDVLAVGEKEITLKVEEPKDYLTPDEYYSNSENEFGTNVQEGKKNSNIVLKGPNILTNEVVGEPLKMYEPDEIINVFEEEVIIDNPDERNKALRDYYDMLRSKRAQRNPGRQNFIHGGALEGGNVDNISFDKLYENGCIIIPFKLDDKVYMDNLKVWNDIYKEYNDKITFVFLNMSYEKSEILTEIRESFVENNLEDLPFYYDVGPNFITQPIVNTSSYLLLNCDNYVYSNGSKEVALDKKEIISQIDSMLEEIESFKEIDARISEGAENTENVEDANS